MRLEKMVKNEIDLRDARARDREWEQMLRDCAMSTAHHSHDDRYLMWWTSRYQKRHTHQTHQQQDNINLPFSSLSPIPNSIPNSYTEWSMALRASNFITGTRQSNVITMSQIVCGFYSTFCNVWRCLSNTFDPQYGICSAHRIYI